MQYMRMHALPAFARNVWTEWQKDRGSRQAAAVSFYMIFSLPPFLLVLTTVAGWMLGDMEARRQVETLLESSFDTGTAEALQATMDQFTTAPSMLMAVVGSALLLFSALGIFGELRTALNDILGLPHPLKKGWMEAVRSYGLSFFVLIVTSVTLVASTVISSMRVAASRIIPSVAVYGQTAASFLDAGVTGMLVFVLFFLLYTFLPARRFAPGVIARGSAVASVLFTVGKFLLTFYIGQAHIGSQYETAAALLVLLVWIWFSAHVFLLGAEVINQSAKKSRM